MTELTLEDRRERAVLCGINTGAYDAESSMEELRELTRTAGADVAAEVLQSRESPDSALYLGEGKLQEVLDFVRGLENSPDAVDLLIFDDELSPSQLRNLEKRTGLRVVDRTMLILDIFAGRARSREGKLQVELAQLQYRLPRIGGQGLALSRLGGGIGTRGPGESKLESDRRHIQRRITAIRRELKQVEKRRSTLRSSRARRGIQSVVLVGYTNAGKSTLMNQLTDAGVLTEDKLFATLDPTARALRLPSGRTVMLIDTVGLIRRLPHQLVEAFHSTLEEAAAADVILNVCDASSPECDEHLRVTQDLLSELGAAGIPTIPVLNKCDLVVRPDLIPATKEKVCISALRGTGLTALLEAVEDALPGTRLRCTFRFPFAELARVSELREDGVVYAESYEDDGLVLDILCSAALAKKHEAFLEETDHS